VGRRGRIVLRWQVAADLIYGQVKKSYRRRKLVRVTHVMRLGTSAALTATRPRTGPFWTAEHRFHRTGSTDGASRSSCAGPSNLGHFPTDLTASGSLEWWRAYYHFVRPHESLRVALVQPQERGGKLAAQRDLQRTPAMAAGRTNRRWTAREVLTCPLPPVSA
jgi:hypothetical protein